MPSFLDKNILLVVSNAAGEHPGPVTPSTADGASFIENFSWSVQ